MIRAVADNGPTAVTIMPTYRCTAACRSCCFGSHPWVEGRQPLEKILGYIREAAGFPTMQIVCFSGGECFLLGEDLYRAIAYANELGLATRCVTNGYWATSKKTAEDVVRRLRDAGLSELNFSTGDNHTDFVPLENILHGSAACERFGIGLAVMVEYTRDRRVTKETVMKHPLYEEYFGSEKELVFLESPWIPMDPEHGEIEYSDEARVNRSNVHLRGGCGSILTTLVTTPQANLKACCGITSDQIPEIRLGSLEESTMRELYAEAEADFIKVWLAVDGPEKILDWASRQNPTIDWENRFAHKCHACQFMYQNPKVKEAIQRHHEEKIDDVLLRFAVGARAI